MPLQLAMTEPPGLTVLGLALRLAPPTVIALLAAKRARLLLAKTRSS